jgi:hypothetical protein
VAAITFDFRQNLPLPHIPVQEIFYMRQLCVYTFGIHNLKTTKTHFFENHEGTAKKGATQVIHENIPANFTELYLFSDR